MMLRLSCAVLAILLGARLTAAQQDTTGILVIVMDRETTAPVTLASVEAMGVFRETDQDGRANLPVGTGRQRIAVRRIGFAPFDTIASVSQPTTVEIWLTPRPLDLDPLTARARREEGGAARERALFNREPVPGVVGVSRLEMRELPMLGEVDVLRALQALPGVMPANDLSARIHVRGGGPDQNVYLLDGARIFAPYHMFGIFGAFNADGIGRAELYRGSLPARYGGGLSSVVELDHRSGSGTGVEGAGGIGMLGARVLLTGPFSVAKGSWMVAARRTHADLVLDRYSDRGFPYAFWDADAHVTVRPTPAHRIRTSFFGSQDRFRMFLEYVSDHMTSRWENAVGSVQWDWTIGHGLGLRTVVWGSRYDGGLAIGGGVERPTSTNNVAVAGLAVTLSSHGELGGIRTGLDLETGRMALHGGVGPGGLFEGDTSSPYQTVAAFVETDRWLGPLRLGPGLRIEAFPATGAVRLAPRLYGRLHVGEAVVLTAGVTRSHQVASTLRDDRYPLPGPPFWFAHDGGMPVSRSDAATVAVEGWLGQEWSFELSTYVRSLVDIPRWRPIGSRTLEGLDFDDGSAEGLSVSIRRHAGRLTGWVGYEGSRVRFEEADTGRRYSPPWEHRNTLEAAVSARVFKQATISSRATFSTGAPFWPETGIVSTWRFDPIRGAIRNGGGYPTWSTEQMRLPEYFRADVSVRWPFQVGQAVMEPYLRLLNITGRQNVLYYRLANTWSPQSPGSRLYPELQLPIPVAFPSLGLDVRF